MTPIVATHGAAFGLVVLDVAARAVRLQLLLPLRPRLALGTAIAVNAYGEAAAAVTPGRVGGDPARFLAFRRAGVNPAGALVAIGVERLINWLLLGAATALASAAFTTGRARILAGLQRFVTTDEAWLLVAVALLVGAGSVALARRYRHRFRARATPSFADAWQRTRELGWPGVAGATALTAVNIAARVAVLPVLAAGYTVLDPRAVLLASFALLYGQLLVPTPGGAGAVELGFIAAFAGTLSAGKLAALLVAWRIYTLMLGAALGGILLARRALGWAWISRPYKLTSSVNVRSQL